MPTQSASPSKDIESAEELKPLPGETRSAYMKRRCDEAFDGDKGFPKGGSWEQIQAWAKAHEKQLDQIHRDGIKYFGEYPRDPTLQTSLVGVSPLIPPHAPSQTPDSRNRYDRLKPDRASATEHTDDKSKPLAGETRSAYIKRRCDEAFDGGKEFPKDGSWEQIQAWAKAHEKQLDQIHRDGIKYFGEYQRDPTLQTSFVGVSKLTPPDVPSQTPDSRNRYDRLKRDGASATEHTDDKSKPLAGETRSAYIKRRCDEAFDGGKGFPKDGSWEQIQAWGKTHEKQLDQITKDEHKYFGLPPRDPNVQTSLVGVPPLMPPDVRQERSGQINNHGMKSMKKPLVHIGPQ